MWGVVFHCLRSFFFSCKKWRHESSHVLRRSREPNQVDVQLLTHLIVQVKNRHVCGGGHDLDHRTAVASCWNECVTRKRRTGGRKRGTRRQKRSRSCCCCCCCCCCHRSAGTMEGKVKLCMHKVRAWCKRAENDLCSSSSCF